MSGTQQFEGKRSSAFEIAPEDIVVIGWDTDDGPSHPAWDERASLPVDDGLAIQMATTGFLGAVQCDKHDDGRPRVRMGRQRVKAARRANEILRARGEPEIKITVLPFARGTTEAQRLLLSVSENEHRQDDSPLTKAQKAARVLASLGDDKATRAKVAGSFGFASVAMLDELLRTLESATPALLAAEKDGKIGTTTVSVLAKLPAEKQNEAAARAKAGEKVTTSAARDAKREAKRKASGASSADTVAAPSRAKIRKVADVLADAIVKGEDADGQRSTVLNTLRWVLGERSARGIPGLTAAVNSLDEA